MNLFLANLSSVAEKIRALKGLDILTQGNALGIGISEIAAQVE